MSFVSLDFSRPEVETTAGGNGLAIQLTYKRRAGSIFRFAWSCREQSRFR